MRSWSPVPIRAVLLDVDGTLYYQERLRLFMALELSCLPFVHMSWRTACDRWRALSIFRHVREELRSLGTADMCLDRWQYVAAAQPVGWEPAVLENLVVEWLYKRPLKYLRLCRRSGLESFLTFLEQHDMRIGVFSDYPVLDKLESLGIAQHISVALCATDPKINAFKPSPQGFVHACRLWGLRPEEVLYVGDRHEVDAVGASSAGMPCAILSRRRSRNVHAAVQSTCRTFSSFGHLQRALL